MSFPRYERYKDSGVGWLGEVPEHWQTHTLKHIVSTPISDGPHETPEFLDEGVPFASAEAVSSGTLDFSKIRGFISREDHKRYGEKYLPRRNDIFMVKSGATTGVTAIVETDAEFNIWSPLAAIRCGLTADPYFVLFYLRSKNFLEAVTLSWSFGTQQNIGMGVIENLCIPLPHIGEQKQIATFLKHEIGKIEKLIGEQRRLIELLKEKRQAVISHAVTKGLNPDASMKESGAAWFGTIPSDWHVRRLGDLCISISTGPFGTALGSNDYVDNGTPVINPSHLFEGTITPEPHVTVSESTAERLASWRIEVGDVVAARRGELGRAAVVKKEQSGWICGTGSLRIRPDLSRLIPDFLHAIFQSSYAREYFGLNAVGATMLNLSERIVGSLPIVFPDTTESQADLIAKMHVLMKQNDVLAAKGEEAITLLQERRSALISAAVTGKIDVRNYSPKEAA